MKPRPVTIINTIHDTSTAAKRTSFHIALAVGLLGTITVSTILLLQGGISLARLRYFIDIGLHPFHITSGIVFILGLLALITFIIVSIGIIKVNKTLVTIADVLLGICSIGLITITIYSFLSITSGKLPASVRDAINKELDQTYFSISPENNIIVENTPKMSRIEKQYLCCGLSIPDKDYQNRQPSMFGSLIPSSSIATGGGGGRGRASSTQRNTAAASTILLPISCCNEKYRSPNNLCVDMFANDTNILDRYNMKGCYDIVGVYKFERIKNQGLTTVIAAGIAVISCIALAAVIRLLGEGYQIVPLQAML
jgi:hypothetical protein